MESLKPLCRHYFNLFNNKDINKLSELFSENIKLIDWNLSIKGKTPVIREITNIFNTVCDINIEIDDMIEENNKVSCQILITITSNVGIEKIEVVDVISFDDLMKIKKIKAYKI